MPSFRRSNRFLFGAFIAAAAGLSLHPLDVAGDPAPVAASVDESLPSLESRFESVTKKTAPAVVAISASITPDDRPQACRAAQLSPDRLRAFLSKTTRIVGTGCVIDPDGFILTNDHVVAEAAQLWVTTEDRTVYPAFVVGSDPRSDLAVLKIPARNLPTVKFRTGPEVCRGQWSIAIGNPFGLADDGQMCVSVGVISAIHKSLPALSDHENRLYFRLIQTTAQINPGSSGGPLFDLEGGVIGINTALIAPQAGSNGIGFAIPADTRLRRIVAKLKRGDEVVYGYLGVAASTATADQRQSAGATASGVRLDSVEPAGPAHDAGLRAGDVIITVNQIPVEDADDFRLAIGSASVDRPVELSVVRNGQTTLVSACLVRRATPFAAVTRQTQRMRWAGLEIGRSITDPAGRLIVLSIAPRSPYAGTGLRAGSLIESIADRPVASMVALQSIINDTPIEQCAIVPGRPAVAAVEP
jgi:serine protease Do